MTFELFEQELRDPRPQQRPNLGVIFGISIMPIYYDSDVAVQVWREAQAEVRRELPYVQF